MKAITLCLGIFFYYFIFLVGVVLLDLGSIFGLHIKSLELTYVTICREPGMKGDVCEERPSEGRIKEEV